MATPKPGRPVRGSTTGRPIMAALDLVSRRWALGVVWQLSDGPLGFLRLQEACDGVSPSVLTTRLKELAEARIVTTDADGRYVLTDRGAALRAALEPLKEWSESWDAAL